MSKAITFKLDNGAEITVDALSEAEIALLRDIGARAQTYSGWLSVGALSDVKRRAEIVAPGFRQRAATLLEALGRRAIASTSEA